MRSRSCARLRPQAFEQRGAYPRAEGGLEARPQRHGTLETERRPLRLRLVAAAAIAAAAIAAAAIAAAAVAAAAVAAAARTTGRLRGRLEGSLGLQRERERAQPGRLRRADPRQRCGAARAAHRDEPPAREEARPRRWAHARTAQAQVEAALAARDAVELRGDRGARLLVEAARARVPQQQHVERRAARRLHGGAPVCARVRACARVCEGV